jgi:OmcA/MtrC family decaheme c-type cytochrome
VNYNNVGFPQDLRNCSKCHDGSRLDEDGELLTPQGDNWLTKVTQQACGACHDDVDFNAHQGFDFIADDGTLDNSSCARCHTGDLSEVSVAYVHWNQLEQHAKNYRFNIESVDYDAISREVTVGYSVTNPQDGTTYDLTADCVGSCTSDNRFYNLRLYAASLSLIGVSNSIADYTDVVYDYAINGADDGAHHYSLTLPALPNDSAEQSHGTARVVSIGQVKEPKINNIFTGEIEPGVFVNVPVLNSYQEFALDGALQSRRVVVSDAKCNACHALLGTASGSNTLENAFHRGARNSVQSCPICHNANRASTTLMTESEEIEVLPYFPDTSLFAGRTFNRIYEFKNMIHGIHGSEQRAAPYTHGNDETDLLDYSVIVSYPGILADCTTCHVEDSYRTDRSQLGSSVLSTSTTDNPNADLLTWVTNTDGLIDPLLLPVFSPKAASCTGCHDTAENREHMRSIGGAAFDLNQSAVVLEGKLFERCDECHGNSGVADVKSVHHIE